MDTKYYRLYRFLVSFLIICILFSCLLLKEIELQNLISLHHCTTVVFSSSFNVLFCFLVIFVLMNLDTAHICKAAIFLLARREIISASKVQNGNGNQYEKQLDLKKRTEEKEERKIIFGLRNIKEMKRDLVRSWGTKGAVLNYYYLFFYVP